MKLSRAASARLWPLRPPDRPSLPPLPPPPPRSHAPSSVLLPSPSPPTGPSCSRWFSCSCCRPTPLPSRLSPHPSPSSTHPSLSRTWSSTSSPNSTSVPSPSPTLDSLRTMKTPHLPLPPTLPYSPTSQPFLRHLQILSLSLLSTSPHEAWDVYAALHPSLHAAIPDDVFASLLSAQLRVKSRVTRWERVSQLIRLARECGVTPRVLGSRVLESCLRIGLELQHEARISNRPTNTDDALFIWLWEAIKVARRGDLGAVSSSLRRLWVGRILERKPFEGQYELAEAALDDIFDGGGGHKMDTPARHLIATRGRKTVPGRLSVLRRVAWCLARDIELNRHSIVVVMDRVLAVLGSSERLTDEATHVLVDATKALTDELRQGGLNDAAEQMEAALTEVKRRTNPLTRAQALLVSSAGSPAERPNGAQIYRSVQSLLAQRPPDRITATDLAIQAIKQGVECSSIIHSITKVLRPSRDTALIVRLARAATDAGSALDTPSFTRLFNLVVHALPADETYPLARRLYADLRAASSTPHDFSPPHFPHVWSESNKPIWQRLFRHAAASHRHLFFASRLYADFLADGMEISEADTLIMIRAAGMRASSSRGALLERHLRDAQWHGHASAEALVISLTTGLTNGNNPLDAMTALDLSRRILYREAQQTSSPLVLPPQAAERIILLLSRSVKAEYQSTAAHLLAQLDPASPGAQRCLDAVLSSLTRSKPFDINRVISVFRSSASRGIPASSQTASIVIRALLQAKQLDSALAVFHSVTASGVACASVAVGRLMINLAIAERTEDADQVEEKWRKVNEAVGEGYDLGVVGARVVVDVKKGIKVDLGKVEEETGWKRTAPFERFVEQIRSGEVVKNVAEEVEGVGVGVGAIHDQESVTIDGQRQGQTVLETHVVPPKAKRAVKPLTRSLDETRRSWLLDTVETTGVVGGYNHGEREHHARTQRDNVDLVTVPSM